jgi:hypothetical protein
MGYVIEIEESKLDKLADYTEKMLRYGGKMMSCLTEMDEKYGERSDESYGRYGSRYGEREEYGMRGGYSSRGGSMGYREHEDWDEDEDEMMHERRGGRRRRRDSRGRYM